MSDPDYAALDPIFWVHHCNIDRLWAAWLTQPQNIQENGSAWLNGPYPRPYQMPQPDGTLAVFTPAATLPGGTLAPTYDDLGNGTGIPVLIAASGPTISSDAAIIVSDAGKMEATMPAQMSDKRQSAPRLLGSNKAAMTIHAGPQRTNVKMAKQPDLFADAVVPLRYYLSIKNITGAAPSGVLTVSLGEGNDMVVVDTVALFGLAKASRDDGEHAGNGLSISLDITEPARALIVKNNGELGDLIVSIEQPGVAGASAIKVGTVSVVTQVDE